MGSGPGPLYMTSIFLFVCFLTEKDPVSISFLGLAEHRMEAEHLKLPMKHIFCTLGEGVKDRLV